MTGKRKTRRSNYHHGNLRAALIDVARRLIVERGPRGFSLVEAATLAGVSPAAPYRHFANREALLAQVALSGYEHFATELETAWDEGRPDTYAAFMRLGESYLRFALYERASFIAMFDAGLAGDEVTGLQEAGNRAFSVLLTAAKALEKLGEPGQSNSPEVIGAHIWALSHGMASLFATPGKRLDGLVGEDIKSLFESGMATYLRGLGIVRPGADGRAGKISKRAAMALKDKKDRQ